ncbi:hypothetical protein BB561_005881 [Smittium simulii]|uniref:Uncharacterized protein n=1 Tax=Smittium simulii TaxID=133385 RepID=A0A2T9Y7U3_9FUNG|nr:hypothetical protein BB561_005881 [Smittium simulii]
MQTPTNKSKYFTSNTNTSELPKGWCWSVEPAATAWKIYENEKSKGMNSKIVCTRCNKQLPFVKDQSGSKLQSKARFRCANCKQYFSSSQFLLTYTNMDAESIPAATTWINIVTGNVPNSSSNKNIEMTTVVASDKKVINNNAEFNYTPTTIRVPKRVNIIDSSDSDDYKSSIYKKLKKNKDSEKINNIQKISFESKVNDPSAINNNIADNLIVYESDCENTGITLKNKVLDRIYKNNIENLANNTKKIEKNKNYIKITENDENEENDEKNMKNIKNSEITKIAEINEITKDNKLTTFSSLQKTPSFKNNLQNNEFFKKYIKITEKTENIKEKTKKNENENAIKNLKKNQKSKNNIKNSTFFNNYINNTENFKKNIKITKNLTQKNEIIKNNIKNNPFFKNYLNNPENTKNYIDSTSSPDIYLNTNKNSSDNVEINNNLIVKNINSENTNNHFIEGLNDYTDIENFFNNNCKSDPINTKKTITTDNNTNKGIIDIDFINKNAIDATNYEIVMNPIKKEPNVMDHVKNYIGSILNTNTDDNANKIDIIKKFDAEKIYVVGFPRMKYRELKSIFYGLGFNSNKIFKFNYIASNLIEVFITKDYKTEFTDLINEIEVIKIVDSINAMMIVGLEKRNKKKSPKELYLEMIANSKSKEKEQRYKESVEKLLDLQKNYENDKVKTVNNSHFFRD